MTLQFAWRITPVEPVKSFVEDRWAGSLPFQVPRETYGAMNRETWWDVGDRVKSRA